MSECVLLERADAEKLMRTTANVADRLKAARKAMTEAADCLDASDCKHAKSAQRILWDALALDAMNPKGGAPC